jgi:hypothetical protein
MRKTWVPWILVSMRYRYLIELADDNSLGPSVYLTTITKNDDSGQATRVHGGVEGAKELASHDPNLEGDPIVWKNPPVAWQPDALMISQWLDDGVEENRDV